jgi:RES domain-containing protein
MRVWRLCKALHAATAFSGEGARLYSGRWNPARIPMVYTSTSLALAALEFFVHLDPSVAPSDLVYTLAAIPRDLERSRLATGNLPLGWQGIELASLQELGKEWVISGRSVALEVPSVVIEGDWNVLLNPAHPDFQKIRIEAPRPWSFDQRMFRRVEEG